MGIDDLTSVRELASVGEWAEELDLLVAARTTQHQPVSVLERDELAALLRAVGLSTDGAQKLRIQS